MDIKIGFVDSPRELDLELGETIEQKTLVDSINSSSGASDKLLWLVDKKGRQVGIMSSRVAYVIVGIPKDERRVGFGA